MKVYDNNATIKAELKKINNRILRLISTLEVNHQPTTNNYKLDKLIRRKNELVYMSRFFEKEV